MERQIREGIGEQLEAPIPSQGMDRIRTQRGRVGGGRGKREGSREAGKAVGGSDGWQGGGKKG